MNKIYKFECGCHLHQLVIEFFDIGKQESTTCLSVCIYEHRSGHTGKLYKKPKLLADVMLHPDEFVKFKVALKNG